MSDLVERLRDERIWGQTHLRHEAADEIEMLWDQLKDAERRETEAERRRERLRAALEQIKALVDRAASDRSYDGNLIDDIREALEIDDD